MTHHMNLNPQPFSMIAQGKKIIELRLLDEKRKAVSVGDTLIFTNTENTEEQLVCLVKNLYIFDSFEKLYQVLLLDKCGYLPEEISSASHKDMEEYYSPMEQKRYGVVGIEVILQ